MTDGQDVRRFQRQLNKIIGKASDPVFPNFHSTTTLDDFNGYCVEVGPNLQKTMPAVPPIHTYMRQIQSMFLKRVSESEIEEVSGFKIKVSTGPDDISAKLIKLSSLAIVPAVTNLINRCIRSEYFPSCLKVVKVVPLYKEGDLNSFENYRPISSLPPLAKILERAIYNRMISYINKFDILSVHQFAFREKHKTIDALACLVEQRRRCLDEKVSSTCVFIGVKKAFDTVDH